MDHKSSSEKKPIKVLISAMVCRGTSWKYQRTSKSPEKHNLLSIILEKMARLLPLPKCYTKCQFSSHFPFHNQTWIFQSCCFLTEPVISKSPSELCTPIVTGHYLIALIHPDLTSWAQFPRTYSYVKTCQNLRSGGLKWAQIWGEEPAGLNGTQMPFTARQLTIWGRWPALQVIWTLGIVNHR